METETSHIASPDYLNYLQKRVNFAFVNAIVPHIQYLVMHNDCVVLPGMGAFIAHCVPARIEGNVMHAPSRTLGFNPAVCHNDGMLASSLARRDGISYQAAANAVRVAIDEMRAVYDVAGEITIERIGTLRRDSNGGMIFEPDRSDRAIAAAAYCGLRDLDLCETTGEATPADETIMLRPERRLSFASVWRVAASVIVLIMLGMVLSTPVIVDRDSRQFASLSIPGPSAAQPVVLPDAQLPLPEPKLYLVMPDRALTTATVSAATTPAVSYRMNPSDRYFLIVASHETAAMARKYINSRPDEQLEILESDGRFRVYAATGTTVSQARDRMLDSDFTAKHPDGWVYRR